MTIRGKLAINVLLLVGFFLVIILVLNIATRRIDEATENGVVANRIVVGVSDMNTITYDYLINPSERATQQWERKHASLWRLIRSARFPGEDKRVIVNRINGNHEDAGHFFQQMIENNGKMKQAAAAVRRLLAENNERNATQLMARSQLMISDAYALARLSQTDIKRAQAWSFWLIAAVILLSMVIAAAISYFLGRTINVSLRRLAGGTKVIAGGDLGYRLPVEGGDEIAQLSAAFNEMTVNLARSREELQEAHDALEDRVEARTRELSESEQRISRILSSITDCYYALDRDWRIIEINDQALKYFGVKREDVLGRILWDVFPAGLGSAFEEQYRRAVSGGNPVEFDEHAITVGRWAEIHAYPYEDRLSVYFKDITERKLAEEILKQRTAALEAANQELENFSYTVAHDLRAPLRAIDGYSALLARQHDKDFDDESRRKIRIIRDNIRNMGQLIEDLLAYSGLGRKDMEFADLDMEALVNEVWREQCAANPGRRMELRRGELPRVSGDRTMLRQVLANLLSNAVKFTKAKELAVIEIGGREDGDEILFFVKDNGAGFDERHGRKLFGVFQRLHGPDEYEGTGVGLAIVERSIRRHGGRVWGESKIDEGATFYFTIPKREGGHEEERSA